VQVDTRSLKPRESLDLDKDLAASTKGSEYRALKVQAKYKEHVKQQEAKEKAQKLLKEAQVRTNFNTGSFMICC
jgi:hypothetical protein